MGALRIGVDSGGTFTDVCIWDEESGHYSTWKVSSTSTDPSRAIADGAREAMQRFTSPEDQAIFFGHGTTVATNALIQGRGARSGLVTTRGFRDLLDLARQRRPHLYDLQTDKPTALVPRDRRLEIDERMLFDGSIEQAPDEPQVRKIAQRLKSEGVDSVAVCFLYSFVDPNHERMVKRILDEEFDNVFVTCSHEVSPEFREYERLSTTVVNAFLGPMMRRYLTRLTPRLRSAGITAVPLITQSNGGTITFDTAARLPVRTLMSGPSTGVVGAVETGRVAGEEKIITFDMGGTSTDVSLVDGGEVGITSEAEVHGYPIKVPMVDIHTVGAGGGSIAHIDKGQHLKVGPLSAGASPGPICYGLGNEQPTVTDANVVLRILNPTALLGGRMPIDRDAAVRAVSKLGNQLGMSALDAASGIVRVVTANMARAIRLISVQRGYDPREYCLVPFGGGGPVHAGRLARELGMGRILVPRNPGILCALGLLLTDLRHDFSRTRRTRLRLSEIDNVRAAMAELRADADEWFALENITEDRQKLVATADLRYAGQNYELNVPLPDIDDNDALLQALSANFEQAYEQYYDYIAPDDEIELVTVRLVAYGLVDKPEFFAAEDAGEDASLALIEQRDVYFPEDGAYKETPVYDRDALRAGNRIVGPAIVEQMDSTTLILPGQTAVTDPYGNLSIEDEVA